MIGSPSRPVDGLICFSHLRWGFVWQRPQHLLTRMAKQVPVLVVEEPQFDADTSHDCLQVRSENGLTVAVPMLATPVTDYGFNEQTNPRIRRMLNTYLAEHGWLAEGRRHVAWYYTPMAYGACPYSLDVDVVVYDVMDELSNFHGAPRGMRDAERHLMATADVVFTGGPSLYAAREGRHPNLTCYPSGVERAHFAQAATLEAPDDIQRLRKPIVGFYGVIDERLDLELLGRMATMRPEWSFVMIGPVVKISQESLPQQPNIHYLGKRGYEDLPRYLAGFDVAILPFALNDSTRFISPTKTLEYLAAERPVVSTPITDVVSVYRDVVEVAENAEESVAAIDRLLTEPLAAVRARRRRADVLLDRSGWDQIADGMWRRILNALAQKEDIAPFLTQPFPLATPIAIQRETRTYAETGD